MKFGIQRSQKAICDWTQNAEINPSGDKTTKQAALDETENHFDSQKYWVYVATDAELENPLTHAISRPQPRH